MAGTKRTRGRRNLQSKRVSKMRKTTMKKGGVFGVTCGLRWKALRPSQKGNYEFVKNVKNNLLHTTTYYTIEMSTRKVNTRIKRKIVITWGDIKKFKNALKKFTQDERPIFEDIDDYKLSDILIRGNTDNCSLRFKQIDDFFRYINSLYDHDGVGNEHFTDNMSRNEIILDYCLYELVAKSGIKLKFKKEYSREIYD